jgi:hypothetical protein
MLSLALEKYDLANRLTPSDYAILYKWALALSRLALLDLPGLLALQPTQSQPHSPSQETMKSIDVNDIEIEERGKPHVLDSSRAVVVISSSSQQPADSQPSVAREVGLFESSEECFDRALEKFELAKAIRGAFGLC